MKNGSVCCYRPPVSKDMSDLRSIADNLFPNYDKIIITGDFNLPGTTHTSTGLLGQNFCDILDDYFMTQLCLTPTRQSNILDLLITNQPETKRYLSRGTVYLKEKFSRLRTQVKKAIKESRESFYNSLGNSLRINPKRLWSPIFKIKSNSGSVPNSISRISNINPESRLHANTPHSIASMFNEYFYSVYSSAKEESSSTQPASSSPLSSISSIELSIEEVCHALQNIDPSKAHGPDGLPSRILKECAYQLAPSLRYLFTKSLKMSQIPMEWKLANIIPIYKQGNKNHVENYRPISLLSVVSKTLERCIPNHISQHIQSNIHSAQFGFVNGRSCATQLLSILNIVGKNLDNGLQTDVVFMDIAKAFDTVDHSKMLQKLQKYGFSGSVLLWFKNYLCERLQRVTVHEATSQSLPISSGVPQGSLLSPFLFSIYINDLSNHLSSSTGVGLFADDTKLYKAVQNPSDALVLQDDIQSLQSWSEKNRLRFNISKCKVLSITRKSSPLIPSYTLDGKQLTLSNNEMDLGVVLNSKLTWVNQVNSVRYKANKMLGFIRRSTKEIHDVRARKSLYLQLVRNNFACRTLAASNCS